MLPRSSVLPALALLAIAILLAACQREGPAAEARAARVRGSHPWDRPGWEPPVETVERRRAAAEPADDAVQMPVDRGPVLPEIDTLDEQKLLGRWLQVCNVATEKMELVPADHQDIMSIQPNGYATWTNVVDFEPSVQDGSWRKTQPGAIELNFGGPAELFGQLYDDNFLYLWNSPGRTGFWFVRIPEQADPRIGANSFSSSRGDFKITRYVATAWEGTVQGQEPITCAGFYNYGVLTMRWESPQAGGFAAFIPSPDWSELRGVWWLENWESVPFSGDWNMTRSADAGEGAEAPVPAEGQSVS